ncbi:hypothetical protein BDV93DRAFT_607054 [Ceratobasidium sp. AG-I]|nr:hypothetical protein BDV93DRAFT_607054 [Ceratobasidium sp. AG-I]
MASFTSLPTESIVHILLFLTPVEIRQCRQICRLIFDVIQESSLQYLIELDSLGYAAPLNPRPDLTYVEKVQFIRELRSTIRSIGSSKPVRVDLGTSGPFVSNCQFSRGVYARGGPSLDITRSLDVYQLASRNKNTEYKQWRHSDLGVNAHDFRIDADMDLLVLLETDAAPHDPETDLQLKFHLRSLRTGLHHPTAEVRTIVSNEKFTSTFSPAGFQIFGKLLAILCFTNALLDPSSPRLSIWNWTTGDLVAVADVPGRNFAFVSATTFAVPYDRRRWKDSDILGSLEIYTFDPNALATRARHVASFHLPATPQSPCHSSSSFVFTPYAPVPSPTVPARIYELAPEAHILCFKIRAFNIRDYPSEITSGILFIPTRAILDAISLTPAMDSRAHIPWEDWAHGTRWVNKRNLFGEESFVFGRRAILARQDNIEGTWELLVYDLGLKEGDDRAIENDLGRQVSDTYLDRVLTSHSAGRQTPSLVATFILPNDIAPSEHDSEDGPKVMVDDEHIIIRQSRTSHGAETLHVYSFWAPTGSI